MTPLLGRIINTLPGFVSQRKKKTIIITPYGEPLRTFPYSITAMLSGNVRRIKEVIS